jgi:hypothetical protein
LTEVISTDTPALNPHIAHQLVSASPAHAWLRHRRLGGQEQERTDDMDAGTVVHALLLGEDIRRSVEVISAKDFRTKAAQEARDIARKAGKVPILEHKLSAFENVADTLHARLSEFGIRLTGEAERKLEWCECSSYRESVLCHGVPDLIADDGTIIELKTSLCAHPRAIQRTIVSFGYDIQMAAYRSALEKHGGISPRFMWLFLEMSAPYLVTPLRPNGEMRQYGHMRWQRAIDIWSTCMATGQWPGYVTQIGEIGPPKWAMAEEIETEVAPNDANI